MQLVELIRHELEIALRTRRVLVVAHEERARRRRLVAQE